MQVKKIALAAALVAAASAHAAPAGSRIAITAGASASFANMNTAVRALCTNAGGTPTTLGSGNFRSIVCADSAVTEGATGTYVSKNNTSFINFAGTNFAELRINTEGSFSAVLLLNGTNPQVRDPAAAANSAVYPAGSVKVGGLLDLEPTAFPATTIGSNTLFTATKVGVGQTFGVAASDALYTKLFNAQKAAGLLPASCLVTDTALSYCVPSIGKSQMSTIMNDNPFNSAYANGLGFLTGDAADNGVELRYVRRVDDSGTQASAQNYFLGLPCAAAAVPVIPQPTGDDEVGGLKDVSYGGIRVMAAPGTGDVRTELNKAGVYALGVVSGENNQTGQTWKWLRVNGAAMAENATPGTATNTNVASFKAGRYDFMFESVYMGGSAAGDAFWATVAGSLNSLAAPIGLINNADLAAGYTKAGAACAVPVSN